MTGTYTPSAIIASEAVHKEYERLRSHENLLKPLGHTDEVFVESTFRIPGFLLFDMEKNSFSELSLKVLLVYCSHQENLSLIHI